MSASIIPIRPGVVVPTFPPQRRLFRHLPGPARPDLPGGDRVCVERVRREHFDLAPSGLWCAEGFLSRELFDSSRARMSDDQHVAEFRRALAFLLVRCRRQTAIDRRTSSYGLKHQAERVMRDAGEANPYVSNGMFLTAALALGFRIEPIPHTPNAWLNLSVKRESRR